MTEAEPPREGTRRTSGLLLASLALSALSLLPRFPLGPVGPLAAGFLAFLGDRAVRRSAGALRGPILSRVAMTAALASLLLVAWNLVRHEATARAFGEIRSRVASVEQVLRSGTPEGAFGLLGQGSRADRDVFVKDLRAAMARLGALESLGDAAPAGGDWDRTASFEEGERATLRLPMDLEGRFREGRGRIRVEVVVRREGRVVTSEIADLRVTPENP